MTPEGQRVRTGGVGEFHRAAVHLATNLGVPIVPIYFDVPAACRPEEGRFARGTARVHALPTVDTAGWTEAGIDRHTALLRQVYLDFEASPYRRSWIAPI